MKTAKREREGRYLMFDLLIILVIAGFLYALFFLKSGRNGDEYDAYEVELSLGISDEDFSVYFQKEAMEGDGDWISVHLTESGTEFGKLYRRVGEDGSVSYLLHTTLLKKNHEGDLCYRAELFLPGSEWALSAAYVDFCATVLSVTPVRHAEETSSADATSESEVSSDEGEESSAEGTGDETGKDPGEMTVA